MTCKTMTKPLPPHGSPEDRGRADAYYGRQPRPHRIVEGRSVYDLTNLERQQYMRGFQEVDADPSFRKIY